MFVRALGSGGFAAFVLGAVTLSTALLFGIAVVPAGSGALGAFAEEFRVWCFGYDPSSGRYEGGLLAMWLVQPLVLTAVVLVVWWQPLKALLRRPRALAAPLLAAAFLVAGAGAGFATLAVDPVRGDLEFPAERLRTAFAPPRLDLTDHEGQRISLHDLRGQVVLVTALYAACGSSCPAIVAEMRRAVAEIDPALTRDLRVLAVTLDPEHDDPARLGRLAAAHGMNTPTYHLLTGPPPEVERVLDGFSVARRRDPETGTIDHANLFILIDREGRIAYRLALAGGEPRWLVSALDLLLRERPPTST